jgi:hypothetical protein
MKKLILFAVIVLALSSCGGKKITLVNLYQTKDYQWHKNTLYIKVHWNYENPDAETIVADGYVEPFDFKTGLQRVRLELVGLDADGKVVSSAEGMPKDVRIASPMSTSPFRISMKLNGKEEDFTVRGSYYHFDAGGREDMDLRSYDIIPLIADEPY